MPKNCGCAGSSCGCLVQGGAGIQVTGIGTAADPFVVVNTGQPINTSFQINSSASVTLTLVGGGTPSDPLILSATAKFPSGATGARPSPSAVGVGGIYYDTTLGKPIWSTGTAWYDATGATV